MLISDFFQLFVENDCNSLWSCDQDLIKQKMKVIDFQTNLVI